MVRFEDITNEKIDKNLLADKDKRKEKDNNFHNYKKMENGEEIQNKEKLDKKVKIINIDIPQNKPEIEISENKLKKLELIRE